VLDTFSTVY